ncbi:MAG TPA: ribonuclease D [Candidatus Udaeobacter sp.]|nr:ribonuclease D [Candidatus Udaeobacter sp.]
MALAKSASHDVIASKQRCADLIRQIEAADRVALDTEADSLHSYREKLCLLQISAPAVAGIADTSRARDEFKSRGDYRSGPPDDFIVDPLSSLDLEPLRRALEPREIVLHAADYDLRMLRRGLNFTASRIFDTVIAARLLGVREFSLGALVKRFFDIELHKHSQKANWALRPLPPRMLEYAVDDVHYLLPLAAILEDELQGVQRLDWFRQSCVRAIESASAARERTGDEPWRIAGAGALDPHTGAVLRALWQWREVEAELADRPPFHILHNRELLEAAGNFASGRVPDYRHFSARRRHTFREAAKIALQSPQSEWPVMRRRAGVRPTAEMRQRADELRERRDRAAGQLGLEGSFIASRGALEAIAADPARATVLLVPWQRELIGI